MKAISTAQGSMFFNVASAGPLTSAWSGPCLGNARCRESAAAIRRAARRQLRSLDAEGSLWQETAARAALVLTVVSAYAAVIWQIGSL